eukprot:scaffold34144_cov17-Tisochrysis_lutea.AAC.1
MHKAKVETSSTHLTWRGGNGGCCIIGGIALLEAFPTTASLKASKCYGGAGGGCCIIGGIALLEAIFP